MSVIDLKLPLNGTSCQVMLFVRMPVDLVCWDGVHTIKFMFAQARNGCAAWHYLNSITMYLDAQVCRLSLRVSVNDQ